VARVGILVKMPEGRMWHVIPSRKWKAYIEMDVKEMGLNYTSWIYWNQDRKY